MINSSDGDVDILAGRLAWGDEKQAKILLAEIQNQNPDFPAITCGQIATENA
jgi:hypothetical protein